MERSDPVAGLKLCDILPNGVDDAYNIVALIDRFFYNFSYFPILVFEAKHISKGNLRIQKVILKLLSRRSGWIHRTIPLDSNPRPRLCNSLVWPRFGNW